MASRVMKAGGISSTTNIGDSQSASYGSSLSFGSAVQGGRVTGGTIKVTNFQATYDGSMYFLIYFGSTKVCESKTFTFGEDRGTKSAILDTFYSNSNALLTTPATTIKVYAKKTNGESGVVANVSSGSTVTITANYEITTSKVGEPSDVMVDNTVSRGNVELAWGAGSDGTANSVTGYDVEQRDSADGVTWGDWTTASGSPVTENRLSVSPPETIGHYRQFRVRTRGSAGSSYYSGYVTSGNSVRRKWDAFPAWTSPTLAPMKSHIRAVLISELHQRVGVIREFYGLAAYSFTPIEARSTRISKWHELIEEIRDAIDEINPTHDPWYIVEQGKPRIVHITQLREIVDEM